MKQYEAEIAIAGPVQEVFDFFADMTRMAEWAPEDFIQVDRLDTGPVTKGSRFEFITRGAKARSVFTWVAFDPGRELEFYGPRLDVGPGWVEGRGGYRFNRRGSDTVVTAWFEPTLGGFLRLMSPFARMRNKRLLPHQLARAKQLIESRTRAK